MRRFPLIASLALALPTAAPAQRLTAEARSAPPPLTPTEVQQDWSWFSHEQRPPYVSELFEGDAPDIVWAGNAVFPAEETPDVPDALRLPVIGDDGQFAPGWFLVHFQTALEPEDKLFLDFATGPIRRTDGSQLSRWYVPNNTLAAYIEDWQTFEAIEESLRVDWVGRYQPAWKLDPSIGRAELSSPDRVGRSFYRLNLDVMPGHPLRAVAQAAQALGATVVESVDLRGELTYDVRFLVVDVLPQNVAELALIEGVRMIQETGDGVALHDLSGGGKLQNRTLAEDDLANVPIVNAGAFPLWLTHNLQGQGQMVGVVDTSIDWNNLGTSGCNFGYPDTAIQNYGFADPLLSSAMLSSIGAGGVNLKIPRGDELGGATMLGTAANEHGSAVAGAAAADFYGNNASKWWEHDPDQWDSWAPTNYSGLLGPGIAHEAQIYFTPVMNSSNQFRWEFAGEFEANMNTTLDNMAAQGVCATAHSTGLAEASNTYTQVTVVHDTNGYDHQDMLQCMAAGNSGAVSNALTSQSVAKNNLAVGASDDVLKPEDRVTFSSIGPRFDGALKPDIMAPGHDTFGRAGGVASALILPDTNGSSGASCAYQYTQGTSFSAPTMTGAAALVHQYFQEGRYSGSQSITDPSAALMRAMLINAGNRLTGANLGNGQYPNTYQGWGEPNLSEVLDFGGARTTIAHDVAMASGFNSSGSANDTYNFNVDGASQQLRITLSWTDEPGSAGTGKKLINDLDLIVTAPGGATYRGNVFNGTSGLSITGGSADTLNNTEGVVLNSPASGAWTVTVDPGPGNYANGQGYALVITGDVSEGGAPTPPAAGFSANPTSGDFPLNVNFTDTSTGSISSWSWNFGDGGSSTAQNPSHTYTAAGTYTVSLTVTGPGGSDTDTQVNLITVSAPPTPPTASFGATPTSGDAPLVVAFNDTSSGDVTSWSWNFGDGGSSAAQNPNHTYTAAGTYTVSLTVSGPGGSDTETQTNLITVTDPPPPTGGLYYLSFTSGTAVPGVGNVADEDIVTYDPATGTWARYVDLSDVGVKTDVNALHVLDDGSLVLSFNAATTIPGLTGGPNGTSIDDSDLVIFTPTSLGASTAGSFSFVFDGSDVGMTTNGEDIDGVYEFPDGGLAISTLGSASVNGLGSIRDEDAIFFAATGYGSTTTGSFSMQFDGSDVGFSTSSGEDIWGVSFDGADMYFCTAGDWSASGAAGADEDVGVFTGVYGAATSGSAVLELDLSALGIATGEDLDGLCYVP